MNEALIVILAFLWALVLLPGAIRARRSSTHATVGGFNRAMEVLRQRPDGRQLMVPEDADRIVSAPVGPSPTAADTPPVRHGRLTVDRETLEQRRRMFGAGLAATVVLLVLALFVGGFLWTMFLLAAAGLGGYTALLRRWKLQRDEAREIVRDLGDAQRGPGERGSGHRPERMAVGSTWSGAREPDEMREDPSGVRIRAWND